MFEKEAEEYADKYWDCLVDSDDKEILGKAFKDGAEFGYNKANEWHYVKDGDLPKKQYDKVSVSIAYLNAFKNPCRRDCFYDGKDFVYWDSGKKVGWKNADIFGTIYAWKYADYFIPEPQEENE
ncbi:MAG: hypothetical protein J6S85_01570 [Methanobrevibacter sp.]|nr:hypothetical protein [Methanobrevibacter sp.]